VFTLSSSAEPAALRPQEGYLLRLLKQWRLSIYLELLDFDLNFPLGGWATLISIQTRKPSGPHGVIRVVSADSPST